MAGRLTTGLAGLDAQLGGGVPPGTVHVLLSEPMNAQELFTYHFAAGDGPCTFLTTEVEVSEVQKGIQRVSPGNEDVEVERFSPSRNSAAPKLPASGRFVLDTFSTIISTAGWKEAVPVLHDLKKAMRKNGETALVTIVNGIHDDETVARLKLWADGVLELGFDRQGFGLYPFLKVTKMRGVPDSARFLLFKETEKGLFMESTRRVF